MDLPLVAYPLLVIAIGMTIIVGLAYLYLQVVQTRGVNTSGGKLMTAARAYSLGNTLALSLFQKTTMKDHHDWAEYNPKVLSEPEYLRARSGAAFALCIATIFLVSLFLFLVFDRNIFNTPTLVLGGAWIAEGADKANLTDVVRRYQLNCVKVIFVAFLCAYIWSVGHLFRRMIARDVTAYAFHAITIRVVSSVLLSIIVYHLLSSGTAVPPPGAPGTGPGGVAELLDPMWFAVAIGFFPETVIRWLHVRAKRVLAAKERSSDLDLDQIEGIDTFTQSRLAEAEIYDAQGLATSNPLILIMRTPFALHQVIDWIGQAQLLVQVKEAVFSKLRDAGVRTSYQFVGLAVPKQAGAPALPEHFVTSLSAEEALRHAKCLEMDPSFIRCFEVHDRLATKIKPAP